MGFKEFYNEAKINDLRSGTSKVRKVRAKPVKSKYSHINKQGTTFFKSDAITTTGRETWTQQIKPNKRPRVYIHDKLPAFRKIYEGEVSVKCDCPDFKYRFGYRASQDGYIVGKKEMLPSDITNPKPTFPEGTICKHLENALSVFKANIPKMYKDWKILHADKIK